MPAFLPRRGNPFDQNGDLTRVWQAFFEQMQQNLSSLPWANLNFSGSSLADLATRSASVLNSGTLPLARLANLGNAQIGPAAAIEWTKISKVGALLTDLGGVLSHAQRWTEATTTATGNQDNVNFGGADLLRCNNGSGLTLRGLLAGVGGQRLRIHAVAANTVTLNHEDANSAAANRILTPTGSAVVITASVGAADLTYDATTGRWRLAFST